MDLSKILKATATRRQSSKTQDTHKEPSLSLPLYTPPSIPEWSQPQPQPQPQPQTQPQTRFEPQPQPRSEPQPQPRSEPQPQPQPEPQPQPQAKRQLQAQSQPEPQPQPQTKRQIVAQPPRSQRQPLPQPQSQAQRQPAHQNQPQPQRRPQGQLQAQSQAQPRPQQRQLQAQPQPVTKNPEIKTTSQYTWKQVDDMFESLYKYSMQYQKVRDADAKMTSNVRRTSSNPGSLFSSSSSFGSATSFISNGTSQSTNASPVQALLYSFVMGLLAPPDSPTPPNQHPFVQLSRSGVPPPHPPQRNIANLTPPPFMFGYLNQSPSINSSLNPTLSHILDMSLRAYQPHSHAPSQGSSLIRNPPDLKDPETKCAICLETKAESSADQVWVQAPCCKNYLHETCVLQALARDGRCPLCRQTIS